MQIATLRAAVALLLVVSPPRALANNQRHPNILLILTDDQDLMLGSMAPDGPCQIILDRIGRRGVNFTNAFVNTPICCPSRAEITTGRYMHNTKVLDNSCGGKEFINGPERQNVAQQLKEKLPHANYTTFYAGKYLNNYGQDGMGGLKRVPPGWDQWYGLQGNSKYYNYVVSNNGIAERHGSDYHKDYFTDRVANRSLEFMEGAIRSNKPFFMTVAPPASHGPNTPAPQYAETYAGWTAPRLPSWNVTGQKDKHYLLRKIIPMDETHANVSDVYFQRRWSVLRSVDDMVGRLMEMLDEHQKLSETYILYTSDHGYHLGEFGMLYDKRMPYETDIRVPLLVRGPGIQPMQNALPVSHIDLAPTILEMAGAAKKPEQMDGRSWLPIVLGGDQSDWRTEFLVEYSGGNPLPNGKDTVTSSGGWTDDVQLEENGFEASIPTRTSSCSASTDDELSIQGKCSCSIGQISGVEHDVSPCDGKNNTYACVRTIVSGANGDDAAENSIYCEFNDPEQFVEYYDLNADPYNLRNLVEHTSPQQLKTLHNKLLRHQACSGDGCWKP